MLIINQIDTVEQLEGVIRKVLKENPGTKPQTPEDELVVIEQAAEILHLSVPTVYGLHHRRKLPGVCKQGKRLFFIKSELIKYLKSGRTKTESELSAEAVTELQNVNKSK